MIQNRKRKTISLTKSSQCWTERVKDITILIGDFDAKINRRQHRIRRHHECEWIGTNDYKKKKAGRPLLPQPAGNQRQHLPPETNPQGHMEISRSHPAESNGLNLHQPKVQEVMSRCTRKERSRHGIRPPTPAD